MKLTKMQKRIIDALEGRLPMEELTHLELKELERRVYKAIARKVQDRIAPGSKSIH